MAGGRHDEGQPEGCSGSPHYQQAEGTLVGIKKKKSNKQKHTCLFRAYNLIGDKLELHRIMF